MEYSVCRRRWAKEEDTGLGAVTDYHTYFTTRERTQLTNDSVLFLGGAELQPFFSLKRLIT